MRAGYSRDIETYKHEQKQKNSERNIKVAMKRPRNRCENDNKISREILDAKEGILICS